MVSAKHFMRLYRSLLNHVASNHIDIQSRCIELRAVDWKICVLLLQLRHYAYVFFLPVLCFDFTTAHCSRNGQYSDTDFEWFLVAYTRLYKSLCWSVGWSVGRSVGQSVGRSVGWSVSRFLTAEFKPKSDQTPINAPAQRTWLMLSCIQTCFRLKL